jgi:hypothetical protein
MYCIIIIIIITIIIIAIIFKWRTRHQCSHDAMYKYITVNHAGWQALRWR